MPTFAPRRSDPLCSRHRGSRMRPATVLQRPRMMTGPLDQVRTPDERYLIVRGRLWRTTNPHLAPKERTAWVARLMAARRAMGVARRRGDVAAGRDARACV